jgi:hypothetical protein
MSQLRRVDIRGTFVCFLPAVTYVCEEALTMDEHAEMRKQ